MPSSRIIWASISAHSLTPTSWALMLGWRTSVFSCSSIESACSSTYAEIAWSVSVAVIVVLPQPECCFPRRYHAGLLRLV